MKNATLKNGKIYDILLPRMSNETPAAKAAQPDTTMRTINSVWQETRQRIAQRERDEAHTEALAMDAAISQEFKASCDVEVVERIITEAFSQEIKMSRWETKQDAMYKWRESNPLVACHLEALEIDAKIFPVKAAPDYAQLYKSALFFINCIIFTQAIKWSIDEWNMAVKACRCSSQYELPRGVYKRKADIATQIRKFSRELRALK